MFFQFSELFHGTGGEDDQFEEEKELIMKEIEKVSRLANLES